MFLMVCSSVGVSLFSVRRFVLDFFSGLFECAYSTFFVKRLIRLLLLYEAFLAVADFLFAGPASEKSGA